MVKCLHKNLSFQIFLSMFLLSVIPAQSAESHHAILLFETSNLIILAGVLLVMLVIVGMGVQAWRFEKKTTSAAEKIEQYVLGQTNNAALNDPVSGNQELRKLTHQLVDRMDGETKLRVLEKLHDFLRRHSELSEATLDRFDIAQEVLIGKQ